MIQHVRKVVSQLVAFALLITAPSIAYHPEYHSAVGTLLLPYGAREIAMGEVGTVSAMDESAFFRTRGSRRS